MSRFKVGVMTGSFRTPIMEAMAQAKAAGVDGIQFSEHSGAVDPRAMDQAARREFKEQLKAHGLELASVCGDLGGHGYTIAADNPERIKLTKEIVDLSLELGTNIITTHVGTIPFDKDEPAYRALHDAMGELGKYAKDNGAMFAIETGPETAITLKDFLDDLPHGGVGVNLDPGNFVMVTREDPVKAVKMLGDYVVHTHAKDGRCLMAVEPKKIYDFFAEGGIEDLRLGDYFIELPLGEGDVDWPAYLEALEAIDYQGYLTIEREVGDDPAADIKLAVDFLRKHTS